MASQTSRRGPGGRAAATRARAAACQALTGLALGAAAACGTAAAPGAQPTAGRPAACAAAALRISLDRAAMGAAAGTSYLPLTFTNISPRPCELAGYPQVTPADRRSGQAAGPRAAVDRSLRARPFTLDGGHSAHSWLLLAAAANFPARQCHPVTAAGLRVTLPGQALAGFIAIPVQVCARPVRGAMMLTVEPLRPGRARRGSPR